MLEAGLHAENSFVTLTYADDNLPDGGSLLPDDLQLWLKRFRTAIEPVRVRFYAVGEYGDESWRPHYHVILFGYPCCVEGATRYDREGREVVCCDTCRLLARTWDYGRIDSRNLERGSAEYVCGYTVKKLNKDRDDLLGGRHPEFARQSRRPGIGSDAMFDVADVMMKFNLEEELSDVPTSLNHGKKSFPLGRLLRRKLRMYVGKDGKAVEIEDPKVQAMYEASRVAPTPEARELMFRNLLFDAGVQQVRSMEQRRRIYKQRKKL